MNATIVYKDRRNNCFTLLIIISIIVNGFCIISTESRLKSIYFYIVSRIENEKEKNKQTIPNIK